MGSARRHASGYGRFILQLVENLDCKLADFMFMTFVLIPSSSIWRTSLPARSVQGDFLVHFMDIARDELRLRPAQISVEKLQSLLELALRTSVCSADPFHEDLTCDVVRAQPPKAHARTAQISASVFCPFQAFVPAKERKSAPCDMGTRLPHE